MSGREKTRVDALSHGNQQRAQLAVALVHDPELLVLDEPFSGLDPGGIDDMSAILAERAAAGVTVLFSSHQLDLVEDICEAVAIIHHGRLVVSGPVAELRRGDRPRLAVRVTGDRAAAWAAGLGASAGTVDAVRPDGTAEISLTSAADSQAILDLARAAGPVEHFAYEDRRLSEVFRQATGASVGQAEAEHAAASGAGLNDGSADVEHVTSEQPAASGKAGAAQASRPLRVTWLVARRELRLRAKTRVFVLTTAIMLIAVALAVALPAILSGKSKPDRIGVVGGVTPTISGIVTEAGRLSGGQAVVVAEPSLAAAEAALRSGDLGAVLVPDTEIIVKQVPLGGVSGAVGNLAQLAGLSKLIQAVPGAASAVAHGVTLPVRGLQAPSTSLSSRLTGLFTVVIGLDPDQRVRVADRARHRRGEVEPGGRGAALLGPPGAAADRQGARHRAARARPGRGDSHRVHRRRVRAAGQAWCTGPRSAW